LLFFTFINTSASSFSVSVVGDGAVFYSADDAGGCGGLEAA